MKDNLLLVDIQPAYNKACYHIAKSLYVELYNYRNISIMYNNEDIGCDSESDVRNYYNDFFAESDVYYFRFISKQYAFFRNWMDIGIDDDTIIKIGRRMIRENVNDSRELKNRKGVHEDYENNIYLPDIDMDKFKGKNWYLGGGGRNECLKEIELLFRIHSIKYELVDHLIY